MQSTTRSPHAAHVLAIWSVLDARGQALLARVHPYRVMDRIVARAMGL